MLNMATVAGTYMMTTMMFLAGVQALTLPSTTKPLLREKQLPNTEQMRAESGRQTGHIRKSPENLLMADHHRRFGHPYLHTKLLSRAA